MRFYIFFAYRFSLLALIFLNISISVFAQSQVSGVELSQTEGILPMVQGATSRTDTSFNILAPAAANWEFQISRQSDGKEIKDSMKIREIRHDNSLYKIVKISVSGLSEKDAYNLTVLERGKAFEQRQFQTLSKQDSNLRFAVGSCMADDEKFCSQGKRLWGQLEKVAPSLDFVLLNGDTVYADSFNFVGYKQAPKKNQIWERYVDSFKKLALFRFKKLVPIVANWDDHDYGINDGDRSWGKPRGKDKWVPAREAKKAFKAFFGSDQISSFFENGPGVSSALNINGHKILMLDGRTFRAPPEFTGAGVANPEFLVSDKRYAHFGRRQEEFFLRQLSDDPKASFIVTGGQFFGAYFGKESYEGTHPTSFARFKKRVSKAAQAPFVLVSGDVHFSEIMGIEREQFGFPTYEFTISPWHSRVKQVITDPKLAAKKNPRRIKAHEGFNFFVVDSESVGKNMKIFVRAYSPDGPVNAMNTLCEINFSSIAR